MPPELMVKFADICGQSEGKIDKVAFVADVRGGELFLKLKDAISDMRDMGIKVKVMFLDCSDDTIMRSSHTDFVLSTDHTKAFHAAEF